MKNVETEKSLLTSKIRRQNQANKVVADPLPLPHILERKTGNPALYDAETRFKTKKL